MEDQKLFIFGVFNLYKTAFSMIAVSLLSSYQPASRLKITNCTERGTNPRKEFCGFRLTHRYL
jgi:hypothetical protein